LKDQINEELSGLKPTNRSDPARIHHKLDELVELLNDSNLSNETARQIQTKFERALKISNPDGTSSADQLLFIDNLDKNSQLKHSVIRAIGTILKFIISLLLILLGFGMIIMPAPPYFEMFTLFHINQKDGITIMDVISLLVVFIGIYLLITSMARIKR